VDERCGLQGVVGPLAPQVARGQAAQLGVDERQQLSEGTVVAVSQSYEQPRYIMLRRGNHGEFPVIKNLSKSATPV
jgi:hypothetical protein